MKKDFTKEDALLTKWKPLLPPWKVTHRKSRKRKILLLTAQLLDNQEKYMKNLPPQGTSLIDWMASLTRSFK
jgi:hypothetical protein